MNDQINLNANLYQGTAMSIHDHFASIKATNLLSNDIPIFPHMFHEEYEDDKKLANIPFPREWKPQF